MGTTVEDFLGLLEPAGDELLRHLPPYDPDGTLALSERLRSEGCPDTLVAAALTQSRLRARARAKFGPDADRLFFTDTGLQQATRRNVALGHARRFAERAAETGASGSAGAPMLDLCCGVGGDLLTLAASGLDVTGVDSDPLTVEMARANLAALGLGEHARVRLGDATDLDASSLRDVSGLFVDPARRSGRGRTFNARATSPPFDDVVALAALVPATGAKLAPGIPHELVSAGTEAEWVSDGGDVVECALWFGPLAGPVRRRATLLPAGDTVTGDGTSRGEVGPVQRFLHEPDGAVIRAGLVAEVAAALGATLLDPTIAYLSAPGPATSPFVTTYEVLDVMPFGLKRLRTALRERRVGRLTVKKRGSAVDPDQLRRQLRLAGDQEATVVLTRVAGAQTVLVVTPR